MTAQSPTSGSRDKRVRRGKGVSALKQMIGFAALALFALAVANHFRGGAHGALWRLFLAIAAFLYLWWLATLVFDLVFVWHRYIQADGALNFLRARVQRADLTTKGDSPDDPGAGDTAKRPVPPATGTPIFVPPPHRRDVDQPQMTV